MKKVVLTLILVFTICFCVDAKDDKTGKIFDNRTESSLNGGGGPYFTMSTIDNPDLPILPGGHGTSGDVNLPLGNGLFILTTLCAGYILTKSKKRSR
ncbi:MAG: hypothetical protein IK004_06150 [Bacteroidales bacterium]|nr:hypothetical protein [Bacteroidales bacterium]